MSIAMTVLAVGVLALLLAFIITQWQKSERQAAYAPPATLPTVTPATPPPATAIAATQTVAVRRTSPTFPRWALRLFVVCLLLLGLAVATWLWIIPGVRSLWTTTSHAVATGRGMTDFPEEKPSELPKVQPGSPPGTVPPAGKPPAPMQVAQWKKIIIPVALPAKGEWVVRDDIDLEPGLAYPIIGTPPPGFFDYEVFPVLGHYDPTPPFPGDELRAGLVSYLIPRRPGKFGYVLKSDSTCRGVWTFEIGKGIPLNQVREFLVYENRRVYRAPQQ